jgi:hypothetical protein
MQLKGLEYLESMHLLAPAGEVVLTPDVVLKFVTPKVYHNHLSFFSIIKPELYWYDVNTQIQTFLFIIYREIDA